MNQSEIWNALAKKWNEFRNKAPEEVSEFLKTKKGRILDLGCGSGRNQIFNKHIEYYGIDFSEEMLKIAEKNAVKNKVNALFFKLDMSKEKLPFQSSYFNSAIFISTLHCIGSASARRKILKELYRILKKRGEILVSVWKQEKKKNFIGWKKDGKSYGRYYYFYKSGELEKLLKSVGFRDVKLIEGVGKFSRMNILVKGRK